MTDELTFGVCECRHFDSDHKGFYWFHMTTCKVPDCPCEKYRKKADMIFKDAYEQGGKEGCLSDCVKDKVWTTPQQTFQKVEDK